MANSPGSDDELRPATAAMRPMVGVEITWLGHASVLIEMDGVRILTDPVLRHRVGPLVRVVPDPHGISLVDCLLISHLHADHADLRSLRAVRRSGPLVAPNPGGAWLHAHGLSDVQGLRAGEELWVQNVLVRAIPAIHDRRRWWLGPAADPVGYLIRGSRSVYFAGDTDLFLGMAELRGQVDAALLPVWGWGSRVGPGHLDPERAAAAVALIAPKLAIPIHWGTYAMAHATRRAGDRERPAREFAAYAGRYAPAVEVRMLAPGEATRV